MDISNTVEVPRQSFTRLAVVLFFMEWVRGAFLVAYLPAYALEGGGLSSSIVGIAVSVHYLTDSLIKGFTGYLLDRFSARKVLHGGFALSLVGLLLMATTHDAWILLAASACLGAGFSPVWIICMSQIREENRAQQAGILYAYWMAGLGLGPVTLNLVMGWGLSISLFIIGLFFAAGWIMAAALTLDDTAMVKRPELTVNQQFAALWDKVKKGGFLVPGMVLQTTAGGILAPFLTSFAVKHVGLSHSQLSIVLLMGGAGVIALLVPMGKWFDHIGGRWFLVIGFGIFSAALFGLTSISSFTGAMGFSLLLGCAYAALLPSWNALMACYIPEDSVGTSWGLLFSIEGLGVVIGPLIGGWLASAGNELLPFQVSASMFGLISVVYLLSPSRLFAPKERSASKSMISSS